MMAIDTHREKRRRSIFLTLPAAAVFAWQGLHAQNISPIPTTVTQEVFRSRWVGPQADLIPRQTTVWTGSTAEEPKIEELGVTPIVDLTHPLRGLFIGPVALHPSLALGWEYSDTSYNGQATTTSDKSSFFVAPGLVLDYERDIGPWSIDLIYSGGVRYYLNPNYTAAGTGSQRNPISQSGSLRISHLGVRDQLDLKVGGSYGTGLNVETGGNLTQASINGSLAYSYVLTEFADCGFNGSASTSLNSDSQNGSNTGDGSLGSFNGDAYFDWVCTGKTRLRLSTGAGDSIQALQGSGNVSRTYLQELATVTYKPTGKLSFDIGGGVSYVQDPGVSSSAYSGIRAIYKFGAIYEMTEKTSIVADFSLDGTDIKPDFRLAIQWQPTVTTRLSLSAYQSQGFSLTTSSQIQVSRGVVGTITQQLFSKIDLSFSAGWQQTENVNLSTEQANNGNDQTNSYGFVAANAQWRMNRWAAWQVSIWASSGNSTSQSSSSNTPETRATLSLNLTL